MVLRKRSFIAAALAAYLAFAPGFAPQVAAQINNPGTPSSGAPANNDCAKFVVSGGNVQSITTAGVACGTGAPGGTSGQVQTNNGAGAFAGITPAQLTALLNVASASLQGAIPAWPNNPATFFRGDGTYAIPGNVLNSQTANYTIATSDCGKTIQAGTGATGNFIITLPAVAGFTTNCVVGVTNGDTARGKTLTGFPVPIFNKLYPGQSLSVGIVNGAWVALQAQGRWRIPNGTTWFLDNVNGLDTNDCLAAGAGGACLTPQAVFNRIYVQLDVLATTPVINVQLAAGQTFSNLTFPGSFGVINLVGSAQIVIDGAGSTITSASASPAFLVVGTREANLILQNMTITNSSTGDGLQCGNGADSFGAGMVFGVAGAAQIHISGYCVVNVATVGYSITAGAVNHLFVESGAGNFNLGAVTVTVSNNPTYSTAFAQAWTNGSIFSNLTTINGTAVGPRYNVSNNGNINTNGAGANFYPGTTPGVMLTGGIYDSPGTPSVSGCGTTPGAPVGKDITGSVVEGTTATGCTIAFTTASAPKSCSVNSSNATVQAGLVITTLSATQLVVTHPSASGATLYWNCPTQ